MLKQEEFKADLKSVLQKTRNYQGDAESSLDIFVNELAGVFIKHIKTLEIKYETGLNAPNGPVTGTIKHTVI
ncbi:hypothetical protein [Sphingobacterium spiritivorum]|uniref:hypothetical protein n=1 Tax=Sphingobacterium spiritivorum TaxID=258 RepID=UPI003DA23841